MNQENVNFAQNNVKLAMRKETVWILQMVKFCLKVKLLTVDQDVMTVVKIQSSVRSALKDTLKKMDTAINVILAVCNVLHGMTVPNVIMVLLKHMDIVKNVIQLAWIVPKTTLQYVHLARRG